VVEIVTPGFDGGDGERRGALVDRVRVVTSPASFPPARTLAAFVVPAALIASAALSAGLAPTAATLVAAGVSIAEALALWTDGQLYSPYAMTLARLLVFAALFAWLLARGFELAVPGSGAGAFGALLLAMLVQGIAATSPVMVSSDVVFHANRLRDAAGGDVRCVIEATGRPEAWEQAMALAGKGGTVVFFGGCAPGTIARLDTRRVHYEELRLLGVFHHTPELIRRADEALYQSKQAGRNCCRLWQTWKDS